MAISANRPRVSKPRIPPLRDLVDLQMLQRIQDWFAATTGLTTRLRDDQGEPVTQTSGLTRFCRLLGSSQEGIAGCLRSHEHAIAALQASDEPVRYNCYAQLLQIALVAADRAGLTSAAHLMAKRSA